MTYNAKKRPLEFFGQDTDYAPRATPNSWRQGSGDKVLNCPFQGNKECMKITKTPPVEIIGCCTAGLPNPNRRGSFDAVITCPKRFLQNDTIFKDISSHIFNRMPYASHISEVKVFSELGTPAPHNRLIDLTMVPFNKAGEVLDYLVIELQATATGSTGPIVPARNEFFGFSKTPFRQSYDFGTNIKMSCKTILEQILHKVPLFTNWKRKTLLIVQDTFLIHLKECYNFSAFTNFDLNHDFFIFSYSLDKQSYGFKIALKSKLSGLANDVERCILPNPTTIMGTSQLENEFKEKFFDREPFLKI